MDAQEFWFALALSMGATAGGAWWGLRRLSQARHLQDTPTSKIRSAAQGYVELYGVLREADAGTLSAPLTGTPCLWWRYKIEEYQEHDKKRSWWPLESGRSEALLLLDDGSGECLIDPRGAEVRPLIRDVWLGSERHPRGWVKAGWLDWSGSRTRYRYTEERLQAGQPLYAIGGFRSSGGGRDGLDLVAAQGAVIREWKGDFPRLLQRFDQDGNGQLDDQEWRRVRLAAQLEAEDRQRLSSRQPVRHQMGKPAEAQPFILANAGEDELTRSFYWQALGGLLLCLAGSLATAWLLGVTVL